jgi:FkbM family methyltransferase
MIIYLIHFLRRLDWFLSKRVLGKTIIKRKLNDFEMFLDLITPGISKTLAVYKTREDDMIQVIKEELKPGMTVIDCGSNIGFYPLLEANILKNNGVIYAIEPDIRNYNILNKNVELCQYGATIKPFQMAVSNKNGVSKMFVAEQSNLNKLSSKDDKSFSERHSVNSTVEVKTTTMDDFCIKENISPNLVRMDIEGFEVEVFQGMKNIFEEAESGFMVFLELHPHSYSKERSFAKELEKLFELGYYAKILISAGEPVPQKYKEFGYSPKKEIVSDGFVRGYYNDVKNEHVIPLTCSQPKASRYVLLEKQ